MAANGHGADYGEYRARGIVLKAEQRALEAELRSLEDRREVVSRPPPDTAAIFADALSNMEALLGDPELVHQANEFLREIVRSIILQPDDRAPDGLAAEIHTGLGSLLFWDR